jgi:hypothetical protein
MYSLQVSNCLRIKQLQEVYRTWVEVLDSLMGCDLGNICAKAER